MALFSYMILRHSVIIILLSTVNEISYPPFFFSCSLYSLCLSLCFLTFEPSFSSFSPDLALLIDPLVSSCDFLFLIHDFWKYPRGSWESTNINSLSREKNQLFFIFMQDNLEKVLF